jgi:hypothetical protein
MALRKLILILLLFAGNLCIGQPMRALIAKKASAATTYATYNSSYKGTTVTLSGGNLVMSATPTNGVACATIGSSTTGKSTGKWYWEITNTTRGGNSSIGITKSLSMNLNTFCGADANAWAYYSNGGGSGGYWSAGAFTFPAWSDYVLGDVIGVALDAGGNTVSFYKNNVLQGTLSISGGNYFPANSCNVGTFTANYGASPFVYTPPAGYNAGYY